jgi:hypothetical protein
MMEAIDLTKVRGFFSQRESQIQKWMLYHTIPRLN